MKIFVARMSYDTTEDRLRAAFEEFGVVYSCKIIYDREENRSKGFGFIEMPDECEAYKAIVEMNDTELDARKIVVKKAEDRR